ncbi:hypothetical protein LINPERPRIM_LOCUS42545 [Linum perenne]
MNKKKKGSSKLLVRVNVLGSSGPIRLVVKEDDVAAAVIESTLKSYAKEGRVPSLVGCGASNFVLYSSNGGFDSKELNPQEAIGRNGGRNFVMCKKQLNPQMTEGRRRPPPPASPSPPAKISSSLKSWLTKSLTTLKIRTTS